MEIKTEISSFRPGKNGWVKVDDTVCEKQVSKEIRYRIPGPSEMKNSRLIPGICYAYEQEWELIEDPLADCDEEILATFKLKLNQHKG